MSEADAPKAAAEQVAATEAAPAAEPPKTVEAGAPIAGAEADKGPKEAAATASSPAATPIQELWAAASAHGHPEIWGVTLADPAAHAPTQIVLQKYLNANDGDVAKAKDQLAKTLDWRAQMQPLELLKKEFDKARFEGLGYVTTYGSDVFTWNIYGGVKSIDETFGNLDDFIAWRVAIMELALQELALPAATEPLAAGANDPYKMVQVHDYKSLSFFRQSPVVKSASTETIRVFAQNYPELLREKFFVNVPAIMGFMYGLMKLFVAPKTIKKFHPMSNGANLAREFDGANSAKGLGALLPAAYGGKGGDLQTQGKGVLLK